MNFPALKRVRSRSTTGLLAAILALCLALTGFTAQPAQAADTGSITGHVFTQAPGGPRTPASSVFIYLYRASTIDGNYDMIDGNPDTDSLGYSFTGSTFSLTGLKAGFYKFEVAGVGDNAYQREYFNNKDSLSGATPVPVGTGTTAVDDMVLEPAGQIIGKVTDRSGTPLANASVSFEDSERGGGGYATTDANGNFTSLTTDVGFGTGLVRGNYRVSARLDDYTNPDAPSYEQRYWPNSATYAGATDVTVTPGQNTALITIVLDVAPRIRLTAKDPAGNPIPNAPVGIWEFHDGQWGPAQYGPNDTDDAGVFRKQVRVGARYKFFITPPTGVAGVTEWYNNKYSATTATEVSATGYGQVLDLVIQLGDAPAVTGTTPTISGTPQVGQTLTAAPGTWGPTGVALTYQWLANNQAITNATGTTYKPTVAEIGKTLSVMITGTLADHTTHALISAPTQAVATEFVTGTTPRITGTARSGSILTATPGAWGPSGVTVAYQWFANGAAIPGAKARTFKLTNTQAGKRVTVQVTGTKAGSTALARRSSSTSVVTGLLTTKKVSISGKAKVGKRLTAKTSLWGAKPIKTKYQWYRNGKKISKQTKKTYTLRQADKGKRITVRVYQSKSSYATANRLSSKTSKVK